MADIEFIRTGWFASPTRALRTAGAATRQPGHFGPSPALYSAQWLDALSWQAAEWLDDATRLSRWISRADSQFPDGSRVVGLRPAILKVLNQEQNRKVQAKEEKA